MISSLAEWLEDRFDWPAERTSVMLIRFVVVMAAATFVLVSTAIVASVDVLPSSDELSSMQVGEIVTRDVFAPLNITYTSEVLTDQNRETARQAIRPIYDPPDPNVARQQTDLARSILDFILNVRRDEFAEREQKISDIREITALDLDEAIINQIIDIDPERWQAVDTEIISVLERVMRGQIQEIDLARIRDQLPTQVSVRFDDREVAIIVAIVTDLIRANTTLNTTATEQEQAAAAEAVAEATRSFERGQLVIASGQRVDEADFEALQELGLLEPAEQRWASVGRALLASIVALVLIGLFLARFRPALLYHEPRPLALMAALFLIVLFGARLSVPGQVYVFPAAALALIYVSIAGAETAVIGSIALALLFSIMMDDSLEIASLVMVGGLIGALTLRRTERLNSYFIVGMLIALGNAAVITLFSISTPIDNAAELTGNLLAVLLNGALAAGAALVGLYVVTLLFNLPTALKLTELSQPNNPLLQRLLREAPGSYQHSLQVANLAEQAANAIGANAQLTHVAALYHDIGKMLNPAFFVENQRYTGNPHDTLNDPYRSADIIISHVTGGDEMAKQYRLPARIREFIREHHGTSTVYVFYKQAVILAGDDDSMVDIAEFSYPGPKPRSRETGILMLADSCEAAVRSVQPKSKQEIENTINAVIDGKRADGQLDDSGLTLKDLKVTKEIFVEMMQAIFHPRINYSDAISKVRKSVNDTDKISSVTEAPAVKQEQEPPSKPSPKTITAEMVKTTPRATRTVEPPVVVRDDDEDDDTPMQEVPRLRRSSEDTAEVNGKSTEENPKESDSIKE